METSGVVKVKTGWNKWDLLCEWSIMNSHGSLSPVKVLLTLQHLARTFSSKAKVSQLGHHPRWKDPLMPIGFNNTDIWIPLKTSNVFKCSFRWNWIFHVPKLYFIIKSSNLPVPPSFLPPVCQMFMHSPVARLQQGPEKYCEVSNLHGGWIHPRTNRTKDVRVGFRVRALTMARESSR